MENTRHRGYEKIGQSSPGRTLGDEESMEAGKKGGPKDLSDSHDEKVLSREGSKGSKSSVHGKPLSPLRSGKHGRSLWEQYCLALETHPLPVKCLTSFTGFFIADSIAQMVTGVYLDYQRLSRMCLFALMVHAPLCHVWYQALDDVVLPNNSKSPLAIGLKIALDQLMFGPVFLIIFWFFLKTCEGHPSEAYGMIVDRLFPTLMVSYMLWPAAHVFNFKFVPSSQRILYINVITIFWTIYLSYSTGQADTSQEVST